MWTFFLNNYQTHPYRSNENHIRVIPWYLCPGCPNLKLVICVICNMCLKIGPPSAEIEVSKYKTLKKSSLWTGHL